MKIKEVLDEARHLLLTEKNEITICYNEEEKFFIKERDEPEKPKEKTFLEKIIKKIEQLIKE